jgi:hypothetical protein
VHFSYFHFSVFPDLPIMPMSCFFFFRKEKLEYIFPQIIILNCFEPKGVLSGKNSGIKAKEELEM